MKITFTGCMHGEYPELPGGDLLIITGDITGLDQPILYIDFFKWFEEQKYRQKVLVAGNHDGSLKTLLTHSATEKVHSDCVYLCDDGIEFEGVKIWGSPWTYRFPGINRHCAAFTLKTEKEMAEKFALIPDDTDILVTHGPPLNRLDAVSRRYGQKVAVESCGSGALMTRVREVRPKLHVFSHIHEGYGEEHFNGTHFINCSHMNGDYDPVNPPITIEYNG